MTIRKLRTNDYEQFRELIREFIIDFNRRELLSGFTLSYMEYKSIDEYIEKTTKGFLDEMEGDRIVLIDEQDGKFRGYINGNLLRDENRKFSLIGEVDHWFVRSESRGLGIGRGLWNSLMEKFYKQQVQVYKVSAFASNSKAVEIYKKYGFELMSHTFIKPIE
jgi:ribosomal protein S18 acetylase RimI-like enzyme